MTTTAAQVGREDAQSARLFYFIAFAAVLCLVLLALFFKSFQPADVLFSNDGPLGAMVTKQNRMPSIMTGLWADQNWLGGQSPAPSPSISSGLRLVTSPFGYAKFFYPFALFVLGLSAWFCFRQWRLSAAACALGGFAAALSSHFFSTACWGVAAQVICVGMNFVAVGLLGSALRTRSWTKVLLAGMAVGMGIMEGYDIGAIFSLFVAAFGIYQAIILPGGARRNLVSGVVSVALVAIFAGFLAAQALSTLVGTQIKGVAGMGEGSESREQRWDYVTQWSFPPSEMGQMVAAGMYGYRMDTPKDMEVLPGAFQGGAYWGEIGRDPSLDRAMQAYEASGRQGQPPSGGWRFSGGGEYAGVLVVLIAIWTAAQSFRKKNSIYNSFEKRLLWFWLAAAVVSLLLSFGRYAPFFRLWFVLPYASTIRNATKFTHTFHWCLVILFAYGVDGLCRRFMSATAIMNPGATLKSWWAKAEPFEKGWVRGCGFALAASCIAWLIYASSRVDLIKHLELVGFTEPDTASEIARFSIHAVGWSVIILGLAMALIVLILSGRFAGPRARIGVLLLGAFLVIDLGRANLPWIIYWNYPYKYATNPVLDFLRKEPFEHRVAIFPLERFMRFDRLPAELRPLATAYSDLYNFYHLEWKQQEFQYYNIQSLDIVQMPRAPVEYVAYETALGSAPLRRWELTNTRYLLGPSALLPLLNNQLDPRQHRFRIAEAFDIVPKAGAPESPQPEDLTATLNTNGQFAVFEFTGALPRASLYSNWQVDTNDSSVLSELPSPAFDPSKTLLVDTPVAAAGATSTNSPAGTVAYKSYAPKHIVLQAHANAASVLLLNDKYDPNWKVWVDGSPQPLLRCNYVMRGVQVPPGDHTIEFRFLPSTTGLWVSVSAIGLGLVLIGILVVSKPRESEPPIPAAPAKSSKT